MYVDVMVCVCQT